MHQWIKVDGEKGQRKEEEMRGYDKCKKENIKDEWLNRYSYK